MTIKLALTVPEAADAAGVTEKQIRAWIRTGDLKAKRQSRNRDGDGVGRYLVTVKALEECLDQLPAG